MEEDRLVQRQEQFRGGAGMKKRPGCFVCESPGGVGKKKKNAASLLFVCLRNESVSKRSAHLSDTTYTGSVAVARKTGCTRRNVFLCSLYTLPAHMSVLYCRLFIHAALVHCTDLQLIFITASSLRRLWLQAAADARLGRDVKGRSHAACLGGKH